MKVLALLWLLMIPSLGRATSVKFALYHGIFHRDCAPWDGAAMRLTLSLNAQVDCEMPIAVTTYQISFWRTLPSAPGEFVLDETKKLGQVVFCPARGTCQMWKSGSVTFTRFDESKNAAGIFRATGPDDLPIEGRFEVKFCQKRPLCG